MQYSRVLKINLFSKPIEFVLKNRWILVLTSIFLFGFSFAVVTSGRYDLVMSLTEKYIKSLVMNSREFSFVKMVFNYFLTSMLFVILCLISGTSMLGVIIIPFLVLVKGYMYGCISSFLYSTYSFEGVAFYAVIILPSAIVFTVLLIFCAIDSIRFSICLARLTFTENIVNNIFIEFKRLSLKLLIYSSIGLVSSVIVALLTNSFINNFSGIN